MNIKLFYFSIFVSLIFNNCSNNEIKNQTSKSYEDCEVLNLENKKKWIEDSLGTLGYRVTILKPFLRCNLNKYRWNEISDFFGPPQDISFPDEIQNVYVFSYRIKNLDPRFTNLNDACNWILKFKISPNDSMIMEVKRTFGE